MRSVLDRFPSVLSQFPDELIEAIGDRSTVIHAKAGRPVVSHGESSSHVYLILDGKVQTRLLSPTGHEVILGDIGQGELFGELAAIDGHPRSAWIVALSDCTLACIPGDVFRAAIREIPAAAAWMERQLATKIRELTEKVFELNALRMCSRLHCELLRMCGGARDGPVTLDPAPTDAELASRIGTSREGITKEIGCLKRDGIIEKDGRRMVVRNLPALRRLVEVATGHMESELLQ